MTSTSLRFDAAFLRAAESLFRDVVSLDGASRTRLLAARCAGDGALRSFVARLLANYDTSLSLASEPGASTAPRVPDAPPLEVDRVLAGRYRILRRLGAGAVGRVYEADDARLPRRVALKVLRAGHLASPGQRRRLHDEAKTLSRLQHDHIAAIVDIASDGDLELLVMEYVAGGTIRDRITAAPISPEETLVFARQLFAALDAAHRKGILHGDLKPENLGVSEYGSLKVLDFGLAALLDADAGDAAPSAGPAPSSLAGTPAYMSPEQLLLKPRSPSNDLFASGIVLYEMLVGARPVDSESGRPYNFAFGVRRPPPPRLHHADLPEELSSVIADLLRHDPEERIASAEEALGRLTPSSAARRPRALRRATAPPAAGVAAVIAAGVLAASYFAFGREPPKPQAAPPDTAAEQIYAAGLTSFRNRDYETARACFRDAVGYDSTFAMAYYQWSHTEEFLDEADEALRLAALAFRHAETLPPEQRDLVESWHYAISGQTDRALRALRERARTSPRNPEPLHQIGRVHFRQRNDPREAIAWYSAAVAVDPVYAPSYNDLSYCYLQCGLGDSALWSAREYVRLRPLEANPYDTLGDIMMGVHPDSAEAFYLVALDRKSDFVVPLEKLIQIEARRGRLSEAEAYRSRMLASDDVIYRAKGRLFGAQLLLLKGKLRDALESIDAAILDDLHDHCPRRGPAIKHLVRAHVLAELGADEDPLAGIEDAIALPTVFALGVRHDARLERVRILLKLGRSTEARAAAESLATDPSIPKAWNALGPTARACVALDAGDAESALAQIDAAIATAPATLSGILFLRAEAAERAGRLEEAEANLRSAIDRSNLQTSDGGLQFIRGWARLARVAEARGDPETAHRAALHVIETWSDCDPELRGVVDEARRRAERTERSAARGADAS